ncbi:MAG: peroxiredoxin [Mesorhizobium sp.]|nr:MAG: peroxiredoxin [Mesorhizobium sp.]
MMIAVGDKLPQATFKTMTADGAKAITTAEIFSGKKVVLFAVPGAFSGGEGKILYLADGNGDFVKSIGLDADLSGGGMGLRSKRFSMIVDDGKVAALNVETKPGVDESGAAHILGQLSVLATA